MSTDKNHFEPSPSRTYVAICIRFYGNYFRKFKLPERGETFGVRNGEYVEGSFTRIYPNNCMVASWYFRNVLCPSATVEHCIPIEQYLDLKDQDEMNASRADMIRDVAYNAPATSAPYLLITECSEHEVDALLSVEKPLPSLAKFSADMGKVLLPPAKRRK
jgi:hypothetical protein